MHELPCSGPGNSTLFDLLKSPACMNMEKFLFVCCPLIQTLTLLLCAFISDDLIMKNTNKVRGGRKEAPSGGPIAMETCHMLLL